MKSKTVSGIMLSLLLIGMSILTSNIQPVEANSAQAMWVDPAFTGNLECCETFTVDICVNITDPDGQGPATGLYAWEFQLFWENDKLDCTCFTDLLPSADWSSPNNIRLGPGIDQDYNATHGRLWTAICALPFTEPYPTPFVGVTSICTVTFHVICRSQHVGLLHIGGGYNVHLILGDDTATSIEFTAFDGQYQIDASLAGDANCDKTVDIVDLTVTAIAFGSRPGDSNWNLITDLNQDGLIDIFDLVIIGINFGNTV